MSSPLEEEVQKLAGEIGKIVADAGDISVDSPIEGSSARQIVAESLASAIRPKIANAFAEVQRITVEACAQIADKYYAQFIDVAGDIGAEIRALSQEAKK